MDKRSIDEVYYYASKKDFKNVCPMYHLTTENIGGYLPYSLKDKNILSVCSSGDHYFNCIASGATTIDLFDINRLTKYMLILKRTALRYLELDEFYAYFGVLNDEHVFDYNIYKKIRDYMNKETIEFFDYVYKLSHYNGKELYLSNMIIKSYPLNEGNIYVNPYLEEDNFYYVKKHLNDISTKYINSNLDNLHYLLNKKYDLILLSNICEYVDKDKYLKTVRELKDDLNEYGIIYFAYLYDSPLNKETSYYDSLLSKDIFSQNIEGTDSYFYPFTSKDKVYTMHKI